MRLEEVEINRAQGLRLVEELMLNGQLLPKNHALDNDDISLLKQNGKKSVYGAWAENGDIDFDTALGVVAAKISGTNLGFRIDERGFCEIAATSGGLLEVYTDRVLKFNRLCPYFILNTIAPFQMVAPGEIIARLEIMVPVLPQEVVDNIVLALSGNDSLLAVRDLKTQDAALLYTRFYHTEEETEHLGEVFEKLIETYQPMNLVFNQEMTAEHTIDDIAGALEALIHSPAQIIFILPSIRNYTSQDVVSSAISSIADDILCPQLPVFGGSDMIIATKKNKKIICLPYNYAYMDIPAIENVLKLAIVKPKLQSFDFTHPLTPLIETISTLRDTSSLIQGKAHDGKNKASVPAVVLAAGQGKRLGTNKLLADINGEPLVVKAVRAAVQSNASPVFVVTGYQAEEIESALENFDVNLVRNPNYYTGIKTSIDLGLKSVPDFCDGTLIIPADMPHLTPEFLKKMIAKFKKKNEKQLILAEKNYIKSNPVIWSKALYNVADLVPENADIRPIFMEHADYTTLVKGSAHDLLDVNFQSDLDQADHISKA